MRRAALRRAAPSPRWRRCLALPVAAAGAGRQAARLRRRARVRAVPRGQGRRQPVQPLAASAHAKAWATLATPEAKVMARLGGLADEPEKAPICLGCHATAADAEAWERDPGFRVEDGVQCEKCHGPGSEYMDEARDARPRGGAPRRAAQVHEARLRGLPLREGLARRRAPQARSSTSTRPGRRSRTRCRQAPGPARTPRPRARPSAERGPEVRRRRRPAARATRARRWATSSACGA